MATDGMLTQEEIDAIFKKATGMEIHHKNTVPSSAQSEPVPAPVAAPVRTSAPVPLPVAAKPQAAILEPPAPVKQPPASASESTAPMPNIIVRNAAAVQAMSSQSVASAMPKAAPDDTVRQLQALVNTLTKRLIEAEKRIVQLEKQNKALSAKINTSSSANVTAIVKEVKRLGGQVKNITANLDATPGYNAHNTFVCTSCGSKGKVAVPMRCTECGREGWKGWFRKR